jgi:hypothetical protein
MHLAGQTEIFPGMTDEYPGHHTLFR